MTVEAGPDQPKQPNPTVPPAGRLTLPTQRSWALSYAALARELAALRFGVVCRRGLAVAIADGTGVRGFRGGAFTLGDMCLSAGLADAPIAPAVWKRIEKIELDIMPLPAGALGALTRQTQKPGTGAAVPRKPELGGFLSPPPAPAGSPRRTR